MSFYTMIEGLKGSQLDPYRPGESLPSLKVLKELRKEIVAFSRQTGYFLPLITDEDIVRKFLKLEVSSEESTFFSRKSYPWVDGYEWYHGWFIPYVADFGLLIFESWPVSDKERDMDYLVLVNGSVPKEWIDKIIYFLVLAARTRLDGTKLLFCN